MATNRCIHKHNTNKRKVPDYEVHQIVEGNHINRYAWTEALPGNWGGFAPTIMIEFDQHTSFMLNVEITYNRRQARKFLAFNSEELMLQLFEELHTSKVFIDPNYLPKAKELEDEDPDMKG